MLICYFIPVNLLFDFLKHLIPADRVKLNAIKLSGRSEDVWKLINQQALQNKFDREKIEATLSISSSHFDKITSQLLSKCYDLFFANDKAALLAFLSERGGFLKHFYQELKRQTAYAEANYSKKELAEFYKRAVNLIHYNMPIIHKDEKVLRMLADKYLTVEKDRNAKLLIECKLLYVQIDKLFAAALIRTHATKMAAQIDSLGPLPENATEELVFAYWWLKVYFYNSIEEFAVAKKIAERAAEMVRKFSDKQSQLDLIRLELKVAEMNYYLSRFEESFRGFKKWIKTKEAGEIPDNRFYTTKFLQICLITGNLDEAKMILDKQFTIPENRLKDILLPRDIISFAKYYLFSGQYDKAFEFILLGFEKNPKGKYFQYEVELRNMQTACFFLSGQQKLAVQMCNKNIKYLRSHGYGIKQSDFPYFYVLTKAIYSKGQSKKSLTGKEQRMLQRYQLGSYAIYGKLLLKMQEA